MLYHTAPLSQRLPINGCVPMTPYEWWHTPPGMRNCDDYVNVRPYILLTENIESRIVPVIITEAGNIQIREEAHD